MPQPVTAGVPIPSYPTPNISDRILVEFHDPRVPGYAALEYGSPHPDTTQYPGFVLVFQEPVERDVSVQRVYVNERLNQDEYNYTIEYPQGGSTKFPRYIRTYVFPDTQSNVPLEPGTPDPVFPGAVLIDQKEDDVDDPRLISKFIKVTRVFDTFAALSPEQQAAESLRIRSIGQDSLTPPKFRRQVRNTASRLPVPRSTPLPDNLTGDQTLVRIEDTSLASATRTIVEEIIEENADPLVGEQVSDATQGQRATITEQMVDDGTPADEGKLVLSSEVEPLGNGKSIKRTVEVPEWIPLFQYEKGVDNLTPQKFRGQITRRSSSEILDPPENPATHQAPDLTGDQVQVREVMETETRMRREITEEVIAEDEDPLLGEETDAQGIITTEESLVAEGTPAEEGVLVKASRVTPLGNGKAIKEVELYEDFPEFVDYQMDTQFWIPREVRKKIVDDAEAVPATIITSGTDRVVTEYQQLDKWRSVRIQTRTKMTGPGGLLDRPAQVWYGVEQHSFPAELISATVVIDGTSSAAVTLSSFSVEVRVRDGYSGPCKARYTEQYFENPPEPQVPTTFEPQSFFGHLTTRNTLFGGAPLGIAVTVLPVRIPTCLHGVVNLNVPIYGWRANNEDPPRPVWGLLYTIPFGTIAATKPAALPRGQYILKGYDTTRIGVGLWKVVKTEIFVPPLLT